MPDLTRIEQQIKFLIEIDKLKTVLRRNRTINDPRHENDAEHSWHLGLYSIILKEYANDGSIDVCKVLKMVLIHDIVEIDAGDAFLYDPKAQQAKAEKEKAAAQRIFGLLPEDQARELSDLWREFEEATSAEARFANAIDRLHAVVTNSATHGYSWKRHGIKKQQVLDVNARIGAGSERLWQLAQGIIEQAGKQGALDS